MSTARPDDPAPVAPPALPRVLLVDDDPSIARLVELALEELPLQLERCANADEARAALARGPVALMLTDLMMPGESGLDMLSRLYRDSQPAPPVRVVVFSADTRAEIARQLAALPLWGQLTKPVPVRTLQACARAALADEAFPATAAGATARAVGVRSTPPSTPLSTPPSDQPSAAERHFGGQQALFEAFRHQCMQNFPTDLQRGDRAAFSGDVAVLRHLGHNLASVLTLLGEDAAAALARTLEQACPPSGAGAPLSTDGRQAWLTLRAHVTALLSSGTRH